MIGKANQRIKLSVGQPVSLEVLAGPALGLYETTAAENAADVVVLVDPAAALIKFGAPVRVSVADGSQVTHYETMVARCQSGRIHLEPPVWYERRQRRQHVRVQVTLLTVFASVDGDGRGEGERAEVAGVRPGQDWVKTDPYRIIRGRTRDLSAGGMMLISPVPLHKGERVRAILDLGKYGPIQVVAECVRPPARTIAVLREHFMLPMHFVQIDRLAQEKVISLVFEVQRRQLAAGVKTESSTARGV